MAHDDRTAGPIGRKSDRARCWRPVGRPRPTRRIVTGRRDCITGEFPSGKPAMDFRMVAYEGLLARDFIVLIESDDDVVEYSEEPNRFRWSDGLRPRWYRPDFALYLKDGTIVCVEVKPWRRVEAVGGIAAFAPIEAAALEAGYHRFELWTEREIDAIGVANGALLASERTFLDDPEETHCVLAAIDRMGGQARVRELRAEARLAARSFRAVVSLVARGLLVLADARVTLDDNAVVVVPGTTIGGGR